MFVHQGTPYKAAEYNEARRLRRVHGLSMKRIAALLDVSLSSVSHWTRNIELSSEQRAKNLRRAGKLRGAAWSELNRQRRLASQDEGRARARAGDHLHEAGCMLYWAEGAKSRTNLIICNSDAHMLRFFRRFLTECFGVGAEDFSVRLHVYTNNGLSIPQIERFWLETLDLPRSSLRAHAINNRPTSSSGLRRNKLPYGVCTLRLCRSTYILQHIYGAIQEYADFDEPAWLDGPRRKPGPRREASGC